MSKKTNKNFKQFFSDISEQKPNKRKNNGKYNGTSGAKQSAKSSASSGAKSGGKSTSKRNAKNTSNNKDKQQLLEGKIVGTKQAYLFCTVPELPDFFIPPKKTKNALNGDTVLIRVISATMESTEAEVVKVLKRANSTLVGEVMYYKNEMIFKADNPKISKYIRISKSNSLGAVPGQKVVCKLIKQPTSLREQFAGEIVEILGANDDSFVLEKSILREFNIYETFPEEVIESAEKQAKRGVKEKDLAGRKDLREEETFTIDGEDARDFDDAVSLKMLPNGNYYLGVHIADVGHYVAKDSVIDQEAYLRGTSVYFPTKVFPMLPEGLSNDICSLKENVERLTISVFAEINSNGKVENYDICESVIKSKARLTYNEVFDALCGKQTKASQFLKTLQKMNDLAKILKNKRQSLGELDLDLAEPYFVIDENNKVVDIKKRERNDAHKLIESFMILANEVVAKHFHSLKVPFVYRIHEAPTLEKTQALLDFLKNFDVNMPKVPKVITPLYYADILKQLDGKSAEETLNKVVLRSLQKAVYKDECVGHFGLALEFYCHFTSPIRRYPDLVIHRIIKDKLHNKNFEPALKNFVFEASETSSIRERGADEAERAIDDLKKCEFMKDKVGQEFDGIITSVNNFGFFVELESTVEGLVRVETLPKDSYLYFEKSLILKGANHSFGIGDKVKVVLSAVNVFERKIDFVLKWQKKFKKFIVYVLI